MKLLLRLGNGTAKVIDNITRAEQFADFHQVFEMQANGEMSTPMATVTPRFWLIHSSDLKKPVRVVGFEIVDGPKVEKTGSGLVDTEHKI